MQFLNEVIYYQKLGFESYQDYLKSPLWREKRQEYRNANLPFFCLFCNRPTPILHHLDYSTLGRENIYKDLIPVCDYHHHQCHWKGRNRIPLIKNALVGRKNELLRKGYPWWRKIGDIRLGEVVNSILYWMWRMYLPKARYR